MCVINTIPECWASYHPFASDIHLGRIRGKHDDEVAEAALGGNDELMADGSRPRMHRKHIGLISQMLSRRATGPVE